MSPEIEFAAGFTFGVLLGAAVVIVRSLLAVTLAAIAIGGFIVLATAGVAGIVGDFGSFVHAVLAFAPFFTGLGIGKVLGVVLASRRA